MAAGLALLFRAGFTTAASPRAEEKAIDALFPPHGGDEQSGDCACAPRAACPRCQTNPQSYGRFEIRLCAHTSALLPSTPKHRQHPAGTSSMRHKTRRRFVHRARETRGRSESPPCSQSHMPLRVFSAVFQCACSFVRSAFKRGSHSSPCAGRVPVRGRPDSPESPARYPHNPL